MGFPPAGGLPRLHALLAYTFCRRKAKRAAGARWSSPRPRGCFRDHQMAPRRREVFPRLCEGQSCYLSATSTPCSWCRGAWRCREKEIP